MVASAFAAGTLALAGAVTEAALQLAGTVAVCAITPATRTDRVVVEARIVETQQAVLTLPVTSPPAMPTCVLPCTLTTSAMDFARPVAVSTPHFLRAGHTANNQGQQ